MSATNAAAYPPVSDSKTGGARRRRRARSASPKRRSASPKRRSASPKRRVVRRRKSVSPSRKAMAGGAKRRSASPKRAKKGTRYENLTLEQLCKKAKKYGVPYSGMKKSQLIRAIRSKKGAVKKARKSAAKK